MRISRTSAALTVGLVGLLGLTSTGPAGAAAALTKPQAKAIANVAVVMQKDLPKQYFTPPRSANEPDRKDERAFYKCLGIAEPSYLGRNVGMKFLYADKVGSPEATTLEVDSKADVVDSVDAAVANQQKLRTAKAVSCYRERLVKAISRNLRGTPKAVAVELLEATVAGADEAWAYRVTFTISSGGRDVSGNGYVLGARVGQALLTVAYTGSGKDFALDEVTALAAKPVARAQQATPASKAKAPKKR